MTGKRRVSQKLSVLETAGIPIEEDIQRWATVTQVSPLRIKLDGETNPLPFAPESLVGVLALNDRVWVVLTTNKDPYRSARRAVILGKSGGDCPFRIGDIHLSINSANPNTVWPNTTWVAWGQGRVPVSHNTSGTFNVPAETTGGEETHVLTTAESPAHVHTIGEDNSGGWASSTWQATVKGATVAQGGTGSDRPGSHVASDLIGSSGGGGAHNNLQPYIVCYMWKRTA